MATDVQPAVAAPLMRSLRALVIPVVAVLLAMAVGALIIVITGANPIEAYNAMFTGAMGSARGWERIFEKATPLIFSGLAVAFAFKGGLFNIGAQGQLVLGAIASAWVGFAFEGLPWIVHLPLALLAGLLAGAIWGAIPGALKAWTGAHEVITTIMLNFVALNLTDYLANGPLKDTTPGNVVARTPAILPSAELPLIGPIPSGVLIAVLLAILIWWMLRRTTTGFEIRTVGLNQAAARYAGINVNWRIIYTMALSGMMAGLGGAVESLGLIGRYQPGFNSGLGFDGITIALLAATNPLGVVPAALLFGVMRAGASRMQFVGVDAEIVGIVQGLALLFVSAPIIVRKLLRMRAPAPGEEITLSTGWGN
ncbi:MAG: ABC transporter permease [Anaerolineales bacterium]|nr:ABC transporter permease [Anaerolineales bacterium]MCB9128093.1 ABC transporter permease [Ardenticatenales bacterium]MCB9172105.1 ABC transporter permease [Ardenticatenales bacterium]